MNLIDKLTKEDLENIQNYRKLFQINGGSFADALTPVESFLQDWNKSKGTLYRALGNCFRKSVPFSYTLSESEKEGKLIKIIEKYEDLRYEILNNVLEAYKLLLNTYLTSTLAKNVDVGAWREPSLENKIDELTYCMKSIISCCFNYDRLYQNEIKLDYLYFKLNKRKELKEYKVSYNMKPFRVLNTVIEAYITNEEKRKELSKKIEQYRIDVSKVNNEDRANTEIIFSIHPLDFMSMSDNDVTSWQSCMNWHDNGCYRVGTVEMMTSNNVICAFIPNKTLDARELYDEMSKQGEYRREYNCYDYIKTPVPYFDKSWRCLFYAEKDILCSGKSYPFANYEMTQQVLTLLHDIIKENLGWEYQYGIQKYLDMKHIWDSSFDHIRKAIKRKATRGKYIIFETKKMYNDMFNANSYDYFCYRNAPKHAKIIGVSGKARCAHCNNLLNGESVKTMDVSLCKDDYNDRYGDTASFVCPDCRGDYHSKLCGMCHNVTTSVKTNIKLPTGETVCSECLKNVVSYSKEAHDKLIKAYPDFSAYNNSYFIKLKNQGSMLNAADLVFKSDVSKDAIREYYKDFKCVNLHDRHINNVQDLFKYFDEFVKGHPAVVDIYYRPMQFTRESTQEIDWSERIEGNFGRLFGYRRWVKEEAYNRKFEPWSYKNWIPGVVEEYNV